MQIQCPKCNAWTDVESGVCQLCGASFIENDTGLKQENDSVSPDKYNGNGVDQDNCQNELNFGYISTGINIHTAEKIKFIIGIGIGIIALICMFVKWVNSDTENDVYSETYRQYERKMKKQHGIEKEVQRQKQIQENKRIEEQFNELERQIKKQNGSQ